jgi:peroxiredoxin (alkyl hydroperoxide reductase subunit C)
MADTVSVSGIQLGAAVPDFELATYDPVKNDFGSVSLDRIKSEGKWTILFFYPADFTFV